MNPEVSVILPFFNAEKTLSSAIGSILNQSFTNFELLLIDNNANDSSTTIAQDFAKKDARVKILQEKRRSVARAMNCGLQNAHGKFLVRMDADDIACPERLEKQANFLKENPGIDFVGSEVTYVPHNKNTGGLKRFVDWGNSFHKPKEIELYRFIEIPIVNPTIMFRRKVFHELGGCVDGNFPEDYEMQLRYLEAGIKMAKLPEPLLEWHDYSSRLTRTDKRYSTEAFFKIKARYFKNWSEKNNQFHPKIWVWGAGRKTRQRAALLEKEGLIIKGYIDIVKSKYNSVYYENISKADNIFIVSMVTNSGAGQKIREFLLSKNFIEGTNFILMG